MKKKQWHAPVIVAHGDVSDLTRGKNLGGHDSFCGSMGDVYFPPSTTQGSTDAIIR